MTSTDLAALSNDVQARVTQAMLDRERLQIIKAPPGAGKTYLLPQLAAAGYKAKLRIAVATFTNAQADDVCRRLASDHLTIPICRFLSGGALTPALPPTVVTARSSSDLPSGPGVVVA